MTEHSVNVISDVTEIQYQEISDQAVLLKKPLLSVRMSTYNHEPYIAQAIEGVVKQETEYPFELIIGEDFSTDRTREIVLEYQKKYPAIIRVIAWNKNVGMRKNGRQTISMCRGKYMAICEGDDYWISSQKLQIQIAAMEKHPELDFSFHSAYRLRGRKRDKKASWYYGHDQILQVDSILNAVDSFAPTSSYIVRREVIDILPDWFNNIPPVGDFFLEMFGSKRCGALYINKPMSIYRERAINSWTNSMSIENVARLRHRERMLESLQLMQEDFNESPEIFKKKKSVSLGGISRHYLIFGNNDLFREYIEKSVSQYAFYSMTQNIAYKLRFTPNLLRWLTKLYFCLRK